MGSKKTNLEGSNAEPVNNKKRQGKLINPADSSFWFWTWIATVFLFVFILWTLILRPDLLERLRFEVLQVRLKNVPVQSGQGDTLQQDF